MQARPPGKQDYEGAIADFSEATRLEPQYSFALYYRGLAKRRKGDTAGADAGITARAINPNVGK